MQNKYILGLALFALLCPFFVHAWPVPDTGQTTCYDTGGNILDPCPSPGEDFYGQDASYSINPMSYTKLDADGNDLPDSSESWVMVRDNVTGLVWEVKTDDGSIHDSYNTYTWYDSNPDTNGGDAGTPGDGTDTEDFINALNTAGYGGYSDWRLPNRKELRSIVDYSHSNPSINTAYFPFARTSAQWSSTTWADDSAYAWTMHFSYAFYSGASAYEKSGTYMVRAVRGKEADALDELIDNGDGTVTNTDTGLMWQQATAPGTYAWKEALAYCQGLALGGWSDWRLPTPRELDSIADLTSYHPSINTAYFPELQEPASYWYWSSTTVSNDSNYAWAFDFNSGSDVSRDSANKSASDICYVRAVRGGQAGSLGDSVILTPKQASSWDAGSNMPIQWETGGLGTNVKISLSRQGGLDGSFETIIGTTPNDGQYDWTVTGSSSVNCVIKIEQEDDPNDWAAKGLLVITDAPKAMPWIPLLLLD